MQVFMTLLNIACNMQNMQNNMHDMQNMQTSFPICRICTAHFADEVSYDRYIPGILHIYTPDVYIYGIYQVYTQASSTKDFQFLGTRPGIPDAK